jgi:hypothetical protein
MSLTRVRQPNPVRAALREAMLTPSVQQALHAVLNQLVDGAEAILRQRYPGETLRVYTPKRGSQDERQARDRRVQALAAAPSSLSAEQIAQLEGITPRRVRQILAQGRAEGATRKSSA